MEEDQVIEKTLIGENEAAYDAAADLADQGCQIVFANSFGHETYVLQAAGEYPEVQFCHATGTQAKASGLANTTILQTFMNPVMYPVLLPDLS